MGTRYCTSYDLFWDDTWFRAKFEFPSDKSRSLETSMLEQKVQQWLYDHGKGDWCTDKGNCIYFFTNSEEDAVYLRLLGGDVTPLKNKPWLRKNDNFVPAIHVGSRICDTCYTKTKYTKGHTCLNCVALE